jgi:phage tail-like protein
MAILRDRPYPGFNFLVDIGDGAEGPQAGLCEVVLPEAEIRTFEYRSGNDKENSPQIITTTTEYAHLVLKRGVIGSLNWYQWWNQVRNGDQGALRNVIVQLLSEDHTAVVLTWKFLHARPVVHRFSPLLAVENEGFYETLELAFERMEME